MRPSQKIVSLFCAFSFIFCVDYFPPVEISPTHSNAKDMGSVRSYHSNEGDRALKSIISQYRNLQNSREEISKSDAAHLLRRTTFGPTLDEIEYASEIGLDGALDLLFTKNVKPLPDFDWIYHSYPPDFGQLETSQKDSIRNKWEDSYVEMQEWWMGLMNSSDTNITEMMVLFWHDHFATSAEVVKFTQSMYIQNQLIREHAFGNFKNLAKAVNYDPAMLQWLDNDQNYFVSETNFTINENYSRELLELFTMGEGTYTQNDIEEAARALTGISTDGMNAIYSPTRHDHGYKTILGASGDIGVDELMNLIFDRPEPAEFICRKLYRWFVYEVPDEEIVHQMAQELIASNYEIEPVLRLLLSSEHFFDQNFRGAKYKDPVWFSLSTPRQLYIDSSDILTSIIWYNWILGQALFYPPDVSGWDGYRSWINTYTLPYRKSYSNQVVDGYEDVLYEWEDVIGFAERFSDPENPEVLVTEMAEYLFAIQPSILTIDLLIEELLDGSEIHDWYLYDDETPQRLRDVIKHMMRLEEFQLR